MERITWLPDALRAKLLPSVEQRIADMDAAGISVQVLSAAITAPGADGAANPPAPVTPVASTPRPALQAGKKKNDPCPRVRRTLPPPWDRKSHHPNPQH